MAVDDRTELAPRYKTAVAMTIAGSDPSGGAGLQADLKTFHQFGVYGTSVIALVTVQNTLRVSAPCSVAGWWGSRPAQRLSSGSTKISPVSAAETG